MAAAPVYPNPKRTLLVYVLSGNAINGTGIIQELLDQKNNNWNQYINLPEQRYIKRHNIQPIVHHVPFMIIAIYPPRVQADELKSVNNPISKDPINNPINNQPISHRIALFLGDADNEQQESLGEAAKQKGYTQSMFQTPQGIQNLDALDPLFAAPPHQNIQSPPPSPHQPPTDEQIATLISLSMMML